MPTTPQPPPPPRRSPLLRCIVCTVLSLILLLGLIILITYLAVHPKNPKYTLEQGSISRYNLSKSNRLNASFHFLLSANNPNKRISLYYDRIDVTVSYEGRVLSVNNVHPFYQPRRNVTRLGMGLVAKDAVVDGPVARDWRMERAVGEVGLDVKIRAKIRMKIGVLKIGRKLKVHCGDVTVPFNASVGFKRVYCDTDID